MDLYISAYVLTSDDDEFSRVQQKLVVRILEAADRDGIIINTLRAKLDVRVLVGVAV